MAKIPKCGRLSRPVLWSTFGGTIKLLDFTFYTRLNKQWPACSRAQYLIYDVS